MATPEMTVLQIWVGNAEPTVARIKAMWHTVDWSLSNGYKYKLIGEHRILGNMGLDGCEFVSFVDYISGNDELRQLLECCVWKDNRTKNIVTSDFARLFYLSENENTLYIDTDAMVAPPMPEFTKDKPWFAWYADGMIDSMLIHGNKQPIFYEIIDNFVMAVTRCGKPTPYLFDLHIVLNKFNRHVNVIPKECFIHKVIGA